jgi:poly(3-hydroxyalkanoate) depolymerase
VFRREFLNWRGQEICVAERGDGAPLFLLSGLGCNADMWAPFVERFPGRRLITFDAPGAGRSSTPIWPISIESLAALAAAVLDNRRVARTDVIGYSYGGAIAQQFAYDYPERLERLVLAATTCGLGSALGSPEALAVLATPLRFYSSSYFERTAGDVYGGVTGRDAALRRRNAQARYALPPSSYGYAMQLVGGMTWSSLGFLPRIRHETLVICGDDDPLVPVTNGKMLAERIPNARLEVVERGGHLLLWDDAERVAPRIGQFVALGSDD